MGSVVQVTVNGVKMTVSNQVSLLKALRDHGINIPSLCFHPAVGSSGNCGLCLIEVKSAKSWQLKRSCLILPADGLQIRTESLKIKKMRAISAYLLLKGGPFLNPKIEPLLLELIDAVSFDKPPVSRTTLKGCILCGLCIKVCAAYGKKNLTFTGRGKTLGIAFVRRNCDGTEAVCGPCRACRTVCPTGYIQTDPLECFRVINIK